MLGLYPYTYNNMPYHLAPDDDEYYAGGWISDVPGVGGQPIPMNPLIPAEDYYPGYNVSDLSAGTWLEYTPMSTPPFPDANNIDALLLVNFPDMMYMKKSDDGKERDSGFYISSGYQFMIVYPTASLPTLDQGSDKQSHGYIRSTNNKNYYTSDGMTAKFTARRQGKDIENGTFCSWTEWQQLW